MSKSAANSSTQNIAASSSIEIETDSHYIPFHFPEQYSITYEIESMEYAGKSQKQFIPGIKSTDEQMISGRDCDVYRIETGAGNFSGT